MQAIDQALRAQRWPTDKTLATDLEVDPRTIRRDIEFMRDERHAPIEFDRAQRGYYYADPTFRLHLVHMNHCTMLALYLSERMMRQFSGTPFEEDLRQAIGKLSTMLPDQVTVRLDAIADFLSVLPAVQAEYDPESFCAVLRAVIGRRRLKMVYWMASRNETISRDFHKGLDVAELEESPDDTGFSITAETTRHGKTFTRVFDGNTGAPIGPTVITKPKTT
jgi:predicted DNA-binding transcriptional regulator YafY